MQQLLDRLEARYNVPSFADNDPVQFPRAFSDSRDIEISAFLTSTISWGRRTMILNDARRLHDLLHNQPYHFVTGGDIDAIGDGNIHRTFFGRHLRYALRGLRLIYSRHGSLEAFAHSVGAAGSPAPAWQLAQAMNGMFRQADAAAPCRLGKQPARCLPDDTRTSALKRFNMALRWLVRNDGIVDIGIWQYISPAQLYIPLDVHSGNTARALGLLNRRANDRRAVEELTAALRRYRPDDPTAYDFALFGAGEDGFRITSPPELI